MNAAPPRAGLSIGEIIRYALVFNPRHWQGDLMATDELLQTVNDLFQLLSARQVDYVLVGGIALLQYVEGRNTEDIVLIIGLPSLKQLPEIQLTHQDQNFARGVFNNLQIDFLLTRNRLFDLVRRRYSARRSFQAVDIPCATVEGLLLLKLYALPSLYRQANFARVGLYENDVATLIQAYRPDLEPILRELASHLSQTDIAAVRDILADIQRRIDRFGQGLV